LGHIDHEGVVANLFCVGFRIAFKPVCLDGLDRHIFNKEKRRITGKCPTDLH